MRKRVVFAALLAAVLGLSISATKTINAFAAEPAAQAEEFVFQSDNEYSRGFMKLKWHNRSNTGPDHSPNIIKIKMTQTDLSEFTSFWLEAQAFCGNYMNTTGVTQAGVFFTGADGTIGRWMHSNWSGSDRRVTYHKTLGGEKVGDIEGTHQKVYFPINQTGWYKINAADISKSATEDTKVDAAFFNDVTNIYFDFNCKLYDLDFDIGALYGMKEDGSVTLLFDPSTAEEDETRAAPNSYAIERCTAGDPCPTFDPIVKYSNDIGVHASRTTGKWTEITVTENMPSDISAYNGISFRVDNTYGSGKIKFNKFFGHNEGTWYDNHCLAYVYPDEGEPYRGNSQEIDAGFKGTVVVPFSSFFRVYGTGNVLDLANMTSTTLKITVYVDSASGFNATDFILSDFKLVSDAKVEFEEYRNVEDADGVMQYVNILHSYALSGSQFIPEALTEGGSTINSASTQEQIEIYNGLVAGIASEEDFNKKYYVDSWEPDDAMTSLATVHVIGDGPVNWGFRPSTSYKRVQYDMTFVENGGNGVSDITARWGAAVTAPSVTRAGYTFEGWFKSDDEGETLYETPYEFSVMPTEDVTLYAKWTANTDTAYTVKHYTEKLEYTGDDDKWELADTEHKTGTTDAQTAAEAKAMEGFTAGSVTQTTIAGDGSAEVAIYYTRNSYTLTFVNGTEESESSVKYGAQISAKVLDDRAGYTYGWHMSDDEGETLYETPYEFGEMPAGDVTLYAKWTANTDTAYTVKHYTEKPEYTGDDDKWELADTEHKTGTTDAHTAAEAKAMEGFTAGSVTQTVITGDGSAEVAIYYTRNSYTLKFVNGTLEDEESVKYGAAVTAKVLENRAGYTYDWRLSDDEGETLYDTAYEFTVMPAQDVTLYAKWTANTDTAYTVKHYTEKLEYTGDDDKWELADTEHKTGTTDAQTAAEAKAMEGFTAGSVTQTVITGDGSAEVAIYYTRNSYTLKFVNGTLEDEESVKYGAAVTAPADPVKDGYTFDGWFTSETGGEEYEFTVMPAQDVTLYAKWTENEEQPSEPDGSDGETGDADPDGSDGETGDSDGGRKKGCGGSAYAGSLALGTIALAAAIFMTKRRALR